jgi:hypothetical protein
LRGDWLIAAQLNRQRHASSRENLGLFDQVAESGDQPEELIFPVMTLPGDGL